MIHHIVIMWDDNGLECIIDYTAIEKRQLVDILADRPLEAEPSMRNLLLRARFNTQRNYEIWAVGSELTEQQIVDYWSEDPEATKQSIRRVGECLYSNDLIKNG